MPRIAFLTLENAADFVIDDALAIAELTRRGWDAREIPWTRTDIDWGSFDVVIIRTTWDYFDKPGEFLATLARIEASGTRLENPLGTVEWNMDKQYLRQLEARGVAIVPSVWGHGGDARTFANLFATLQDTEIVVKPNVSAGATDTFRLHAPLGDVTLQRLVDTFADRDWFAQPFVRSIVSEGEYSVFYFGGRFSHAIRKVPRAGDFRVQEEHGGEIIAIPASAELRHSADRVMAGLAPTPLQARIDLVRLESGALALMELELIEPSLYFRMDERSPAAFADALERALTRSRPG
jgi:glutathione synthase/RimK-type ligase-like ATP-grasp enzyme